MAQWDYRFDVSDVFHNENMSFAQIRDAVVNRIREQAWHNELLSIEDICQDLESAQDPNEFDEYWDMFYDWCDYERVWVVTR